jgi:hypothetical protein
LYKKYIKEIFIRMKQFKDELLASCLEFLLSLPKELIVCNLDEVFDSLQVKKLFILIFDIKDNINEKTNNFIDFIRLGY